MEGICKSFWAGKSFQNTPAGTWSGSLQEAAAFRSVVGPLALEPFGGGADVVVDVVVTSYATREQVDGTCPKPLKQMAVAECFVCPSGFLSTVGSRTAL